MINNSNRCSTNIFVTNFLCRNEWVMSSEIYPQSINPAIIEDGVEAPHNKNCAKNGASKNTMYGSVQGTKPCCLKLLTL